MRDFLIKLGGSHLVWSERQVVEEINSRWNGKATEHITDDVAETITTIVRDVVSQVNCNCSKETRRYIAKVVAQLGNRLNLTDHVLRIIRQSFEIESKQLSKNQVEVFLRTNADEKIRVTIQVFVIGYISPKDWTKEVLEATVKLSAKFSKGAGALSLLRKEDIAEALMLGEELTRGMTNEITIFDTLNMLNNIPRNRREQLIALMKALTEDLSDPYLIPQFLFLLSQFDDEMIVTLRSRHEQVVAALKERYLRAEFLWLFTVVSPIERSRQFHDTLDQLIARPLGADVSLFQRVAQAWGGGEDTGLLLRLDHILHRICDRFIILKAVSAIPFLGKRRTYVLSLAQNYFDETSSNIEIAGIIKALSNLPEKDREAILSTEVSLPGQRDLTLTPLEMILLRHASWTIPQNSRRAFWSLVEDLLREIGEGQREIILRALPHIGNHPDFFSLLGEVTAGMRDPFNISLIIEVLKKYPLSEREALLKEIKDLLLSFDHNERVMLLSQITKIPSPDRPELVAQVKELLSFLSNDYLRSSLAIIITTTSPEEIAQLFRLATALFTGDGYERLSVLEELDSVAYSERAQLVALFEDLLKDVESGWKRGDLINSFAKFSPQNRVKLSLNCKDFLAQSKSTQYRIAILKLLRRVNSSEWEKLLPRLTDLLVDIPDDSGRVKILEAIQTVSPEEFMEFIPQSAELIRRIASVSRKIELIRALGSLPSRERAELIPLTKDVLADLKYGYQRLELLNTIISLPASERVEILSLAKDLLTCTESSWQRSSILRILSLIPGCSRCPEVVSSIGTLYHNLEEETLREIAEGYISELDTDQRVTYLSRPEGAQQLFNEVQQRITTRSGIPSFTVRLCDISQNPLMVLQQLSEHIQKFRPTPKMLFVCFLDENGNRLPGVDVGGLSRQLFGDLFSNISATLSDNFDEVGPKTQDTSPTELERELFIGIGHLLNFCLFANGFGREYKVGEVFSLHFYRALKTFNREELLTDSSFDFRADFPRVREIHRKLAPHLYTPIDFDERENEDRFGLIRPSLDEKCPSAFGIAAIAYLNNSDETLPEGVAHLTGKTTFAQFKELSIDEKINIMDQYPALYEKIADLEKEEWGRYGQKGKEFYALHLIAKGIYQVSDSYYPWTSIKLNDDTWLTSTLCGSYDTEMIISRLKYENDVSENTKQWLSNWIRQADKDLLQTFLKTLTGSSSVGWHNLYICPSVEHDGFYFHTCAFQIDVPEVEDYETFKMGLEHSLGGEGYTQI